MHSNGQNEEIERREIVCKIFEKFLALVCRSTYIVMRCGRRSHGVPTALSFGTGSGRDWKAKGEGSHWKFSYSKSNKAIEFETVTYTALVRELLCRPTLDKVASLSERRERERVASLLPKENEEDGNEGDEN